MRAISRVAHEGAPTDRDLIEAAATGTAGQSETLVRGLRTVEDATSAEPQPQEYVSQSWSSPAQWRL